MSSSRIPASRLVTIRSNMLAHGLGGLLLIAACGFVVLHFLDSLWAPSIDLPLHYALVSRLSEDWHFAANNDPSLQEMNTYPRYSHRLGALAANVLGSPIAGLHFVALLSVAVIWSGIALMLASLQGRWLWIVSGILGGLLLVNGLFVHLELFGRELVGNYFFPQLVSQAAAMLIIALALWLDKKGMRPLVGYVLLGAAVPLLQQFHLLPALETLAMLALLIVLDLVGRVSRARWASFGLGVLILVVSIAATVSSSAFGMILGISDTRGLLKLKYTPTMLSLGIECTIAIMLSAVLIWQWMRAGQGETKTNALALKYLGLFGLAAAGLCLLQLTLLNFGYGSQYAVKKYAFGVNTSVVLDLAFLPMMLIRPLMSRLLVSPVEAPAGRWDFFQLVFPGLFVVLACLTALPSPAARYIALGEIASAERIVKAYEVSNPPDNPRRYDFAFGLFPVDDVYDYLITIGVLKTPRADNADDVLNDQPPSKPNRISRIFAREGVQPWDVPACRQAELQEGIIVLDGACVLEKIKESGASFSP